MNPALGASEPLPALVLVQAPRLVRRLAVTLVVAFAFSLTALVFAPWQQTVAGRGRVIGYAPLDRQQTVEAPVDGRVVRFAVQEGSRVRTGDELVRLEDVDPLFVSRLAEERSAVAMRAEAASARIRSLEDRLGALGLSRQMAVSAASARAEMATDRLRAAEHAVEVADASLTAAELNQPRVKSLAQQGLRSTRDEELTDLELRRARAERSRAEAAVAAARNEITSLEADRSRIDNDAQAAINDAKAGLETARAELASATAELARAEVRVSRQDSQLVRAPRDGTVLRLLAAEIGHVVKQGDPLVVIVPDDSVRAAELHVDGNDASLVQVGRKVRLQFEGWPGVQFSGWPSVAVGTFGGVVTLIDAADNGDGDFRVLVSPDPSEPPWPANDVLRQGVRVSGWILLDVVALGYEVWRQLNGFPPAVAPQGKQTAAAGAKR